MADYYSYCPAELVRSLKALKDSLSADADEEDTPSRRNDYSSVSENHDDQRTIVVAATQMTGAGLGRSDLQGFVRRAESCVEKAATTAGANLILLPELFCGPYFCQSQEADLLQLAHPLEGHFLIHHMRKLAMKHEVVLPISFYERHNNAYFNTMAVIDADGTVLDKIYRKSHIPDGTGYQEKFYFSPGDTGFQVFDTKVGRIGIAICWDQWFPEAARSMALQGAEVLLYPTAIGTEPQDPSLNSADHWQRVMQGHAAANMVPVVASNRFGTEILLNKDGSEKQRISFYGRSFITDNTGAKVAECQDNSGEKPCSFVVSTIDPEENRRERAAWGLFRDRRPELYGTLLTKDGSTQSRGGGL